MYPAPVADMKRALVEGRKQVAEEIRLAKEAFANVINRAKASIRPKAKNITGMYILDEIWNFDFSSLFLTYCAEVVTSQLY